MGIDPSKLVIVRHPDPVLRKVASPVTEFNAELREIAERMIQLMREAPGVGLAAPQVGLSIRMFVCQPGESAPARVMINPKLTPGDETDYMEEGCLSLPDVTVDMRRSIDCKIEALDVDGKPFALEGSDLEARVWQHEYDHLDGRLIIDFMSEAEKIANRKLIRELERKFADRKR